MEKPVFMRRFGLFGSLSGSIFCWKINRKSTEPIKSTAWRIAPPGRGVMNLFIYAPLKISTVSVKNISCYSSTSFVLLAITYKITLLSLIRYYRSVPKLYHSPKIVPYWKNRKNSPCIECEKFACFPWLKQYTKTFLFSGVFGGMELVRLVAQTVGGWCAVSGHSTPQCRARRAAAPL